MKRRLKTGEVETRPSLLEGGGLARLAARVARAASPDLTLKEHCEAFDEEHGVAVSTDAMSRTIARLHREGPLKKAPVARTRRGAKARLPRPGWRVDPRLSV